MRTSQTYYVVCIDYGSKGREAIVDPEISRREVVARIKSGEYRDIHFIHEIDMDKTGTGVCEDVTSELLAEASMQQVA